MDNKELGQFGEDYTASYLSDIGYRVVARNYRSRYGEIDMIAMQDDTIVFVEVKARRSRIYGEPKEAVGIRKQQKLIKTAIVFLQENNWEDRACRFDVVEVIFLPNGSVKPCHIENAFA